MKLDFIADKNPIHRVNPEIYERLVQAQQNVFERSFENAFILFNAAADDLRLAVAAPTEYQAQTASQLADISFKDLCGRLNSVILAAGIPQSALQLQTINLARRIQLLRAFHDPDAVVRRITQKIGEIVDTFPKTAADIERGRNPGDVLDPYILAAAQILLYQGNFQGAIEATVAHKALMIIEGLLGHLHEDVVGEMRGNIRAPEPRGINQEIIDLGTNPFPGADVVQPPKKLGDPIRFHQVKSKTGSAKGGDGKRLGGQLKVLHQYYGGEVFYDALIGTTLRGHRSMNGVLTEAPQAIVLVGAAAFQALTSGPVGAELLLRVYQAAFAQVSRDKGYHIDTMAAAIVEAFKERSERAGEGFLEVVLHDSTDGLAEQQDSRRFLRARRVPPVEPVEET